VQDSEKAAVERLLLNRINMRECIPRTETETTAIQDVYFIVQQ